MDQGRYALCERGASVVGAKIFLRCQVQGIDFERQAFSCGATKTDMA